MIVIDSSALIAILMNESDADTHLSVMAMPGDLSIAAPTIFETMLVAISKKEAVGINHVENLIAQFEIQAVPFTPGMAHLAADAFHRFGRGRHKAALTFGDCMSNALAKSLDAPLLYKGNDLALTDIHAAA